MRLCGVPSILSSGQWYEPAARHVAVPRTKSVGEVAIGLEVCSE